MTPEHRAPIIDITPPTERDELFNRADPHCERCAGMGQRGGTACACTFPSRAAPWPRTITGGIEVHKTGPEGGIAWFVPSRSEPGVFYRVTQGREGAKGPLGHGCTCPAGRRHERDWGHPWQESPTLCRHVRAVLAAETQDGIAPPPPAPVHPGLRAN